MNGVKVIPFRLRERQLNGEHFGFRAMEKPERLCPPALGGILQNGVMLVQNRLRVFDVVCPALEATNSVSVDGSEVVSPNNPPHPKVDGLEQRLIPERGLRLADLEIVGGPVLIVLCLLKRAEQVCTACEHVSADFMESSGKVFQIHPRPFTHYLAATVLIVPHILDGNSRLDVDFRRARTSSMDYPSLVAEDRLVCALRFCYCLDVNNDATRCGMHKETLITYPSWIQGNGVESIVLWW